MEIDLNLEIPNSSNGNEDEHLQLPDLNVDVSQTQSETYSDFLLDLNEEPHVEASNFSFGQDEDISFDDNQPPVEVDDLQGEDLQELMLESNLDIGNVLLFLLFGFIL